jgi:hypothetical protein
MSNGRRCDVLFFLGMKIAAESLVRLELHQVNSELAQPIAQEMAGRLRARKL